jgi:hypothetical protein
MAMTLPAPDRLRYVTSRYPQLQGARLIPLSFVFLMSACWRVGGLRLPGDHLPYGAPAWFFGGLAAAIVVSYPIRHWYLRSLGTVGQHAGRSAAIPIFGTCFLVVCAVWLQAALEWRLSLAPVTVGAVLLATGLASGGLRSHYVVAGALFFASSVLAPLEVPMWLREAARDAVVGLTLLITGVGDHRLLTETLRRPSAELT